MFPPARRFHAEVPIQRDADRVDPQAGRRRGAGQRGLPPGWHQRGDLLPVEVEVRWPGGVGPQAGQGAGSRERPAQAPVRGAGARQRGDEGPDRKKNSRAGPQARGGAVPGAGACAAAAPVLCVRGAIAGGLVPAAAGLDGARCRTHHGARPVGRGLAGARLLEVPQAAQAVPAAVESQAHLPGCTRP
jgi:hypothetical protein